MMQLSFQRKCNPKMIIVNFCIAALPGGRVGGGGDQTASSSAAATATMKTTASRFDIRHVARRFINARSQRPR